MKFKEKINIPLSTEDKQLIKESANRSRQTVSSYVRQKLFEKTELSRQTKLEI